MLLGSTTPRRELTIVLKFLGTPYIPHGMTQNNQMLPGDQTRKGGGGNNDPTCPPSLGPGLGVGKIFVTYECSYRLT